MTNPLTQDEAVEMVKRVAAGLPQVTVTVHAQDLLCPGVVELIEHVGNQLIFQRRVTDRMLANSPLALSACLNMGTGEGMVR